jgi:mannose/cellobiose epimerase-like protein (N-acyl-D-glucosamine 2-epimerase family)
MSDTRQILRSHCDEYERIAAENMALLLNRYERDGDYPFIDTKLNLITGDDHPESPDELTIYSRDVIYGWIQGRGLEALVGHIRWLDNACSLPESQRAELRRGLMAMLAEIVPNLERLRARMDGRLSFMFTRDGTPLERVEDGGLVPLAERPEDPNHTDTFYAKGLFCAAKLMGDDALAAEAEAYYARVVEDILEGKFISDQQPMDPKNPVRPVPGRLSHGPYMIALGGVAVMAAGSDHPAAWGDRGERLIHHILGNYVNRGQFAGLKTWDYVEFIRPDGTPYDVDGTIMCDPGHALEFVGLAAKTLLAMEGLANADALKVDCADAFPGILTHTFALGFNEEAGGICKGYDLAARNLLNSDMPWWSLPETLRACALTLALYPELDAAPITAIFEKAHAAFVGRFLNPAVANMAYQTRDASGNPVPTIPAVPDADPGYHTGLSLLDVVRA